MDAQRRDGEAAANGAAATKPRQGRLSRRPWTVRAALLLPLYGAVLVTILVSIQLIRYTVQFPDPRALTVNQPGPTLKVLARDGSVIADRGERNDFLPLDQLPRHLVDAVIATEDRRFYSHWGLDPTGLLRASFANLRAGRTAQGGSTLTQQLAKNLFLSTDRTIGRKLEEAVLALWLELRLSKREILELYLNRVYFGGGAYGVEAAARRFFEKSARSVTLAEAAVIAGLLKAPSKYSPFANPGYARARARIVLGAMHAAEVIGPVAHAAAVRQSVQFADPSAGRRPTGMEFAVDYVLDEMPPLASVGKRAIIVETTLDAGLQKQAQTTIAGILDKHGAAATVGQGAIVVLDTAGGIRAMVGGRSWTESQFNRAVKARRQPGSAFKPLVYLAALEQGMGPEHVVADAPIDIDGWSPRNDDGRYRGPITLRQALAHSINTVAVRLQQQIGAERIAAVGQRLGIESRLRPDASLALGTSEVGLLELTSAYGVLAAGGQGSTPHALVRIRTSDGEVLFERRRSRPRLAVAPDVVGQINSMLNTAIVSGTGRRAAIARHQAGGKTGTTQDFRDAWFVGYTGHLVAGVWLGNDDGKPMSRVSGGSLPAQAWHDVMTIAHQGLTPRALPAIDVAPEASGRESERSQPPPAVAAAATVRVEASSASPPAQPVILNGGRASPPRRGPEGQPKIATPDAETPLRMPSQSIDPDLFARVTKDAAAEPGEQARGSSFDPLRIREALGGGQGLTAPRMGLGVGR